MWPVGKPLRAGALMRPGGVEEELDEAEFEAVRLAVVLADPARYQDADGVYAADAAEKPPSTALRRGRQLGAEASCVAGRCRAAVWDPTCEPSGRPQTSMIRRSRSVPRSWM
jgi:hypothetical protein